MNISEVKQIRITDFLQSLGHRPVKIRCGQYGYLSPLRTENTPSFKVNDPTNEWYDFGIAEGGGIIELAMLLYQTSNINEVLRHISTHADGVPSIRSRPFCPLPGRIEDTMKNITVSPLNHYALLSYLHSRSIDTGIAQKILQGDTLRFIQGGTISPSLLRMCPADLRCAIHTIKDVSGKRTSPS